MAIKYWERDTPEYICLNARIDSSCFETLPDLPKGLEIVENFLKKTEEVMVFYGKHWIVLSEGDSYEIVRWLHRMTIMYIDVNLIKVEIKKMPLTDWNVIAFSMGRLSAERSALEGTLQFNGVKV